MKTKQIPPLAFGVASLSMLAITGVQASTAAAGTGNFVTGSGHGVTATYVAPTAPAMQSGATAGEEALAVTTTNIALPSPKPGVG